jgi:4'-phosphopantetheinyl transferase
MGVLDDQETERMARLHFSDLRESLITSHGALRFLLGHYLGLDADQIRFAVGPQGKPRLEPTNRLSFNMAHSGVLAVIALTMDCHIGVDVERLRPLCDFRQVAAEFFCPEEVRELMSLPREHQQDAFFCGWARKEAYLKASEIGLSTGLNRVCVPMKPNSPARIIHVNDDANYAREWTLVDLTLAPLYRAALAYRARQRSLSYFRLTNFAEFTQPSLLFDPACWLHPNA